ncbi:RNA polymerase sigma factor [Micromonospora sp. CPCC 206061]|uniref:RNA polymerase sigma factor n=1 Tax=Micromonospora sp. CPCC 206061 TaxID=3122410 RepID=UPI002FEEFA3E
MNALEPAAVHAEPAAAAELNASFEAFCREHYLKVQRFLQARCADPDLVQEAVQEAFVTARAKWDDVREFEKPLGWLLTTARYKLMGQLKLRRQNSMTTLDEVPDRLLAAPTNAQEARDLLAEWLRQLPRRQSEILQMSLDGWSDEEIARVLGVAYNTVRTYKRVARQRLRRIAEEAGFRA